MKYKLIVELNDGTIHIDSHFNSVYELKTELRNMGTNGIIYFNTYYPPNRIYKITFNEDK